MRCNELILHIGSGTHLSGGADQHSYLTTTNLFEKLLLFRFGIGFVDKLDLLCGDATGNQLFPDVIVDIEGAVTFRRGEVTKQELGRPLFRCFAPYPVDLSDAGIDLTAVLIGEQRVDDTLVKRQLSAVICDLQHIVNAGGNTAASNTLGSFSEGLYHPFLNFRRLHGNVVVLHLRHREMEHIGGFDVCNQLEHRH